MKHWKFPYYVCLLSAALYHGASHQKPQVFQVMVDKVLRPIKVGQMKIESIYKKAMSRLPTKTINVKTGFLNISSRELTLVDILQYPTHSGGLNNIATVMSELIENINLLEFKSFIRSFNNKSILQSLGFILEKIETMADIKKNKMIEILHKHLNKSDLHPIPLIPELPVKGMPRNRRWMVIENTIESAYSGMCN